MTRPKAARKPDTRASIARQRIKNARSTHASVGRCPACGKLAYETKAAAKTDGRTGFAEGLIRVYRCEQDSRWWHFTSRGAQRAAQWRDDLVFRRGDVIVVAADAEQAAGYVAAVVRGTGSGPVWSQLRDVMGWPAWAVPAIMEALRDQGWVTFTEALRSLRPGPRVTDELEAFRDTA